MTRVLVIGGTGNFGARIVELLVRDAAMQVIVGGRSADACAAVAARHPHAAHPPETCVFDIRTGLQDGLARSRPDIVIHTSGPFQGQNYDIAEACIEAGIHYLDLADGRDFVTGIGMLDQKARARGVTVISGASSVPCLTAAILDDCLPHFARLEAVDYGIATAQRTHAGLATTAAILGYAGKPFPTRRDGAGKTVYGWQGLRRRNYPELGRRLLGYCDIPDLSLFPERYPDLKTIEFRAGIEVPAVHLGLWALSWLVRAGLVASLRPLAPVLQRFARCFDAFGSDRSGFHMEMTGITANGPVQREMFYILTGSGHGPYIPCIPSVLCAAMIARGNLKSGAFPCVGIVSLAQYLAAFSGLDIKVVREGAP